MIYSQNNEQILIEKYFGNYKGTLLDIGANDGVTLSNSYALIQRGWRGSLVEPSPKAFEILKETHRTKEGIFCFNAAICDKTADMTLYESGSHLGDQDVS